MLAVCDDLDPDRTEGSKLTYLHAVAVCRDSPGPEGLDTIEVPVGTWAVFLTTGPHPSARNRDRVVSSNPWRLRPGPGIVAVLERADGFSTATCELWLPVNRPDRMASAPVRALAGKLRPGTHGGISDRTVMCPMTPLVA